VWLHIVAMVTLASDRSKKEMVEFRGSAALINLYIIGTNLKENVHGS